MAIKNPKLGGTYRAFGSPGESPDENDTDDAIIDLVAVGVTQNTYQTLKHSGTFDNKDNLGADRFADENGVNNTVNTGSSTSYYDDVENKYSCLLSNLDSNEYSTSSENFVNIKNYTGLSEDIVFINFEIRQGTSGTLRKTYCYFIINYSDATNYTSPTQETDASTSYQFKSISNPNPEKEVSSIEFYLRSDNGFSAFIKNINYISKSLNANVVCDSNIKTLTGNELGICVYADEVNTANTNITYNVSDGTTTISDLALNTMNGIASLGSGQLEITFNLSTTDTNETPELYGYSYYII